MLLQKEGISNDAMLTFNYDCLWIINNIRNIKEKIIGERMNNNDINESKILTQSIEAETLTQLEESETLTQLDESETLTQLEESELLKQFNEEFGSDEELEQDVITEETEQHKEDSLVSYSIKTMINEAVKHFRMINRTIDDDERFFYSKETVKIFWDNFTPNPKSKFVVKQKVWKNYDAQWSSDRQSHDCWIIYTEAK